MLYRWDKKRMFDFICSSVESSTGYGLSQAHYLYFGERTGDKSKSCGMEMHRKSWRVKMDRET